mgnify:CR=1 FL=1
MTNTTTYEVILRTEHSELFGYSENRLATITVPAKESGDIGKILRNAVCKTVEEIKHQEQINNDPFLQWLKQKTVEEIKHQEQINNDPFLQWLKQKKGNIK